MRFTLMVVMTWILVQLDAPGIVWAVFATACLQEFLDD